MNFKPLLSFSLCGAWSSRSFQGHMNSRVDSRFLPIVHIGIRSTVHPICRMAIRAASCIVKMTAVVHSTSLASSV